MLITGAAGSPSSTAPKIIIKLDDLRGGGEEQVSKEWRWLGDFFRARLLKASIGVICNTLEGDDAEYLQWIKDLHKTGLVEFWYHAHDHLPWTASDGQQYNEFDRPYEEQRQRFARGQQLARQKLGLPFHVFGSPGTGMPGPATNAHTVEVVAAEPDMKAWLYGPTDAPGRWLLAEHNVTVLDRVRQVNIEQPIFVPSLEDFRAGYFEHAAGRDYFVIQGHPQKWDARGFTEFEGIVDFALGQGCAFVTPSEYVTALS